MHAIPLQNASNRPRGEVLRGQTAGSAAEMFAEQDSRGTILRASEPLARLFGTTPARLGGMRLTDLVSARQHPQLLEALNKACARGSSHVPVDLRRGARVPHALLEITTMQGGGFRTRFRPLVRGSTEKAVAKPAPTLPVKSDRLADVSHEIRTPLNAVIGFADALRQESFGPLGDKRYRDYARLIQESGQHVLALINDLLDLSKAEADKVDVQREPVRVRDLVEGCTAMMRLEAERAGLSISSAIAPDVGIHAIDAKVVRQIILNLISNALKFTKEGGVTIRTRILDGRLVIAVEDTGVGMSPEDLNRVGERFYQARREGVRGGRGSGLGLALSSALAQAHSGSLDLLSKPGRGTVATLTLPLLEKQGSPRRYQSLPQSADVVALEQGRARRR